MKYSRTSENLNKRAHLTATIPVHTCLQFHFTIIRQVKAYTIKNQFSSLASGTVLWLFWFNLLSTFTTKSYSQSSISLKCQLPLLLLRCHYMKYWDQTLYVETCSELRSEHSAWVTDAALAAWWWRHSYKLLRIKAVKQKTCDSLHHLKVYPFILENIKGHWKLDCYL